MSKPYIWRVPHQIVEVNVIDGGDIRCRRIDQPLQPREHVIDERFALHGGEAREIPKVLMLVWVKEQRKCQRIDDLGRRGYVPALLEPGVPGDADPGQLGDVLASKTGSATPTECAIVWQPDVSRPQSCPLSTQKSGQLGPRCRPSGFGIIPHFDVPRLDVGACRWVAGSIPGSLPALSSILALRVDRLPVRTPRRITCLVERDRCS